MTTIIRFILCFLLAPTFAVVGQAAGVVQDDFRIVDAGLRTQSGILDTQDGDICNYDSSGALLQQRSSLDGKAADEGDPRQFRKFEASEAARPLFVFLADFVATNKLDDVGRFWSKSDFNGTRVYQRNDLIDPGFVDPKSGLSNLQLMQRGRAPLGPDGHPINLHHTIQSADSPLAEVTRTFHQQNSSIIHINPNTIPSGIDRSAFNAFRRDYWKNRATDFE